ncbi:MAG: FAD-dependent oxidoreductase, partial [Gaiellaceae bacterium]|nr:FAD-dependent oxidoreductase [Gaiellaceae bacterium]
MPSDRIGVVGAGLLGLAVARHLVRTRSDATVSVLEKEREIALHQSGRNSGVVHAGIYYPPGSLKASLCRRGVTLLRTYCEERGIPYLERGKIVVATTSEELARLADLERRSRANGVPQVRILRAEEIPEVEPNVAGLAALHSPTTAVVEYRDVARALRGDLEEAGGELVTGFEVTAIRQERQFVRVRSSLGEERVFDRLVVCAGLHSDRLARLAGDDQ